MPINYKIAKNPFFENVHPRKKKIPRRTLCVMFEHVNTYFVSEKVSGNWNNPEWNTRISRSNAVSILIL